jgi:hypothetical protein
MRNVISSSYKYGFAVARACKSGGESYFRLDWVNGSSWLSGPIVTTKRRFAATSATSVRRTNETLVFE